MWNNIYNSLVKNINVYKTEYNGNNLIHLSCINNNTKIIKYISDKFPSLLLKSNKDGNNCLHLLATYRYTPLLKYVAIRHKENVNLVNNKNETISHLILENIELMTWFMKNTKIDINIASTKNMTPLIYYIKQTRDRNDIYFKMIILLLEYDADINLPNKIPPLYYSVSLNKYDVTKLLIKYKSDVNCRNGSFSTPIYCAIKNNNIEITELLIKNYADINLSCKDGTEYPLFCAMNNYDILKLLLKYDVNKNIYDNHMNTPAHMILKKKYDIETNFNVLLDCDMNKKNTNGVTPLYLLLKYHDWKNYTKLLKNKELDIFIEKKPLELIKKNEFWKFLDFIIDRDGTMEIKQKNKLRYKMLKEKKSCNIKLPHVNFIESNKSIHGLFNSDITHNAIYLFSIIKKYDNIFIPYQHYIKSKAITDENKFDVYKLSCDKTIYGIISAYNDIIYELLPHIIVWKDRNNKYVHERIQYYINNCINSKIRFVYIKLSIVTPTSIHANILLYDKNNGILERFEPYGLIPNDLDGLDLFLESVICKYFNAKYIKPYTTVTFQTLSNDNDITVKKLGDPPGYCLAWSFWFLEYKMENQNISSEDLIKMSIDKINDIGFINFIRNYANKLDSIKNEFLLKAGVKHENLYNIIHTDIDLSNIYSQLSFEFKILANERI